MTESTLRLGRTVLAPAGSRAPYVPITVVVAVASLLSAFGSDSFARTLDSTERIATVVARYAAYRRSFGTVNAYYRTLDSLTTADLRASGSGRARRAR